MTGPFVLTVCARRFAVAVLVVGLSGLAVPRAEAAPAPSGFWTARQGHGHGRGIGNGDGPVQRADGTNTANSPTIRSPARQISTGRRNVNAPAANSAVTFAGIQQVSSVSVFTNTLNGNCRRGINHCMINQNLRTIESRGGVSR